MVMRIWHGVTRAVHAEEYAEYVKQTGVRMYEGKEGYRGVFVLRRVREGRAEFYMMSLWDSMESVRAMAGPEPDKAMYPFVRDKEFLLELEPEVAHFEVLVAPETLDR